MIKNNISEQIKEIQKNLKSEKITNSIIEFIVILENMEIKKDVKLYLFEQIEKEIKRNKDILED